MQNSLINTIIEKLDKKEEIAPFLFLGATSNDVEKLSTKLAGELGINKNFIFIFPDTKEKIKVKDIKEFLEKVFIAPTYKAQIFIIENISRMTEESANSCLKVFEEPPFGNVFFLTSESESSILDTILSRCTIINSNNDDGIVKNELYYALIDDYIRGINHTFASYVFKEKLEKEDYINILKNIILYLTEKLVFLELIEEINDDINGIQKNNLLPKYVVDKYVIKLKEIKH